MIKDFDYAKAYAPTNFMFGVASAPFLCEGGYNYPHGIKNNMYIQEKTGKIEKSREAVRFWTDYEAQIKLAASLGLNAYRIGIEWARVQPTTAEAPHDPPAWDYIAVDNYARIAKTLIDYKLEPIITLHHFCHPAWLDSDMWLGEEGPRLWVDYALKMIEELNERLQKSVKRVIKHFTLINEPNTFLVGMFMVDPIWHTKNKGPEFVIQAYDNLFSSYVKAYDRIHDLYERKGWGVPDVAHNQASVFSYENDKMIFDIMRLLSWGITQTQVDTRLNEYRDAWYKRVDALAGDQLTKEQYASYINFKNLVQQNIKPSMLKKTLDAIYDSPRDKKMDSLQVNIYDPFGMPRSSSDISEAKMEMWEYLLSPDIYRIYIHAHNDGNRDLPLHLNENNVMYRQPKEGKAEPRKDGWTREKYLKSYLPVMIDCMKEGVPIRQFLWWSIVDDYEWKHYDPRVGLFNYDYTTHEIKNTDGLGEPAGRIFADMIAALRCGDEGRIKKAFEFNY